MQAVKLSGVGNIPNLRRVLLVDANYVTALRPALNAILPSGALFVRDAAAVVLEIGFVPGTASWTQISAGEGYDMQLVIPCPYDYVAAAQAEQRLRGCRWLAIVEDLNGAVRKRCELLLSMTLLHETEALSLRGGVFMVLFFAKLALMRFLETVAGLIMDFLTDLGYNYGY
jgi:hypothetical protein